MSKWRPKPDRETCLYSFIQKDAMLFWRIRRQIIDFNSCSLVFETFTIQPPTSTSYQAANQLTNQQNI